jgi:hypothetical protein
MIEHLDQNNRKSQVAYVLNPKYGFTLVRGPGKQEWTLRDLFLGDPTKVKYADSDLRTHVLSALTLAYPREVVDGWLTKANADGGEDILSVDYQQPGTIEMPGDSKGRATFQRSKRLALVGVQDTLTLKGDVSTSKVRLEYQGELNGFARLAKRTVETWSPEADGTVSTSTTVDEFDLRYDENVPDTEFTLTAFGLPEPKGITWERPAQHGWLWWGLAGLALIAAGYGLYRWRHRQAAPKPAS